MVLLASFGTRTAPPQTVFGKWLMTTTLSYYKSFLFIEMAEVGIAASIIQIADLGLRLSLKIYTFGEIVATADKFIISIAKDVSLTSMVLKELVSLLDQEKHGNICSQNAVQTADDIVKECLDVFEEMEGLLVKKFPNLEKGDGGKVQRAMVLLERLKWPYLQPKLELMRTNLERLKSTLNLMLNVIALARYQFERSVHLSSW